MKLFQNIYSVWGKYKCNHAYLSRLTSDSIANIKHLANNSIRNASSASYNLLSNGPSLKDFIKSAAIVSQLHEEPVEEIPYLPNDSNYGQKRKVYFDIYGCQMNVNDTEIVWSILQDSGFLKTDSLDEADVVLVVTCAIRDGAETKIWNRLDYLKAIKNKTKKKRHMKIGVLGCMAERLKHKLLENQNAVDLGNNNNLILLKD